MSAIESLIQLCETHPDRHFSVSKPKAVGRTTDTADSADTQDQTPKWGLTTHSLQPRHPVVAWLWLNDPLFRVSPMPLKQRILLESLTSWQERCANLDFPRVLSKKKALEGFGAVKPEKEQARASMLAMERWNKDEPVLWILWNDEAKTLSFLDDKAFPREGGYKYIWILREPSWDRLWDASEWNSAHMCQWIEKQEEEGFKVDWPLMPAASTIKAMGAQYQEMGFTPGKLTKEELRYRLGRALAIRALCSAND